MIAILHVDFYRGGRTLNYTCIFKVQDHKGLSVQLTYNVLMLSLLDTEFISLHYSMARGAFQLGLEISDKIHASLLKISTYISSGWRDFFG